MRRSVYFLAFIGISVILMSASDGVAEIQNKDRTGTPDGDDNCTACHNDGNFAPSITINVNDDQGNPVDNYIPGETYDIGYIITSSGNPSGYGFQSTVLFNDLSNAGELLNPSSNAQLNSVTRGGIVNRHIVEHNAPSGTGFFNVDWIAPENEGNITFYASGNVVNGDNDSDGDRGTSSVTKVLTPDPTIGIADELVNRINITVSQGGLILSSMSEDNLDRIRIHELSGRLVFQENNLKLPYALNLELESNGIYLVTIEKDGSLATEKLWIDNF